MCCHAAKAESEYHEGRTVPASTGPPARQNQVCSICMSCYKPKGAKTVTPQS
eukprot:CAMPEP_0174287550 /NCGR_PEP_ID=MMETSP0809-20121228/16370_1 /TAXON_ID=73025 ORGANISM="Eutreptiella gymnastica-like, Strain CCMP1594" /NCGR_SAMPLE_ID=MMETSP0809 /ASSEMBLY_ACC=CAM_ASM_000658 /LENGTH=51 /DNA_ID=CAMNT_0015384159 /DNA_START=675 /DNA_END=827 /DNA_ORIENTATION=-